MLAAYPVTRLVMYQQGDIDTRLATVLILF
jgi:hypothetical protein